LGPERLLIVGAVADGSGTVIFAFSHSFTCIVLARAIVGLGDALIWLNIVLVLVRRFAPAVFGRVLGAVAMAGNIGALMATTPLAWWIGRAGWRLPFMALGGVLILLAGLSGWVFFRTAPAATGAVAARRAVPWARVLGAGRRLWAPVLAHFGLMGPFLGFVSLFAVSYLRQTYHFSEVTASSFLAAGLMGSLVGGPVAGALADRYGVSWPYRAIALANGLGWGIWATFSPALPVAAVGLLFFVAGFANGASVLTFAATRQLFSPEDSGLASGLANTAGFLAAVLVPGMMGWVLAHAGAWSLALAVVVPFAGIGVMGTALVPTVGWMVSEPAAEGR
jgi:predicted MFS family arabinose efflux permease